MLFLNLYLIVACPLLAQSAPTHVVHERRADVLVEEWAKGPRLDASELIPVRIALTQSNLDKGHDILMDISDPASASYGKHLTEEEVIKLFAPKKESVAAVSSWLQDAGIQVHRQFESANKQWIKFDATAAELESLLHTKFHVWQHQTSLDEDVACEEYHVPHSVHQHIDYIMPGIHLRSTDQQKHRHSKRAFQSASLTKRMQSKPPPPPGFHGLDDCAHYFYPQCIAATYNYTIAKERIPQKGNELGFLEDFGDGFNPYDFEAYTKAYDPRIPKDYKPEICSIDGAARTFPRKQDRETGMDVEIGASIVYPQRLKIFQARLPKVDHKFARGWYNNFLDAIDGSYCTYKAYGIKGDSPGIDPHYPDKIYPHPEQCGVFKPTNVISASNGGAEAIAPANYLKRQCNEYMKLGMRGISIVFCSQDAGVGGAVGVPHIRKSDCLGKNGKIFAPIFPASCPYVTAVGATGFGKKANILDHNLEIALQFSGGGFSNIFAPLHYQHHAVQTFLTKHKPPHKSYSTKNDKDIGKNGGVFNRAGRGFPDVSALGEHIVEDVYGEGDNHGDGTSSATPIWAALFNRINEERLAANKSLIGFVNPALYANPAMMNDITHGYNFGCSVRRVSIGFNATTGWDPISGLGSPNYGKMLEYFMKLQ